MTNENVQQVLDQIRPALGADDGDVELVEVKDGRITSEKQLSFFCQRKGA